MQGRRLRVAIRVRGGREGTSDQDDLNVTARGGSLRYDPASSSVRLAPTAHAAPKHFPVDEYVPSSSTNAAAFRAICRPLLDSVMMQGGVGDTLCFLAYGHTCSGKSHTVGGSPTEDGLLTLCAQYLMENTGAPLELTMLEVYNEKIFDLLHAGQQRSVRRIPGGGVVVQDLSTCVIQDMTSWYEASDYGLGQRRTAANEINPRSSRSHAVFTLKSEGIRVCFVDLAGSERQNVFSKQLDKDSISINKSLSRLSTVIEALSSRKNTQQYINYRDTMLTILLQRYIGGCSLTTFVACVHPTDAMMAETLSTLRYSARLRHITTPLTATRGGPPPRSRSGSMDSYEGVGYPHHLISELTALRLELQRREAVYEARETSHLRRINELEATAARPTTLSLNSSICSSSGTMESVVVGQQQLQNALLRRNDTKRVAGWLLSRCLATVPKFTVQFDDHFASMVPSDVNVIGYVTSMACLFPRDAADDAHSRIGLLDVGDVALGLTMLDAGIPPYVALHTERCRGAEGWETHDFGNGGQVYVLAVFEVDRTVLDDPSNNNLEPPFSCCDATPIVSTQPLIPFAIVFAVHALSPLEHHQAVFEHLVTLESHQKELEAEVQEAEAFLRSEGDVEDIAAMTVPLSSMQHSFELDRDSNTPLPSVDIVMHDATTVVGKDIPATVPPLSPEIPNTEAARKKESTPIIMDSNDEEDEDNYCFQHLQRNPQQQQHGDTSCWAEVSALTPVKHHDQPVLPRSSSDISLQLETEDDAIAPQPILDSSPEHHTPSVDDVAATPIATVTAAANRRCLNAVTVPFGCTPKQQQNMMQQQDKETDGEENVGNAASPLHTVAVVLMDDVDTDAQRSPSTHENTFVTQRREAAVSSSIGYSRETSPEENEDALIAIKQVDISKQRSTDAVPPLHPINNSRRSISPSLVKPSALSETDVGDVFDDIVVRSSSSSETTANSMREESIRTIPQRKMAKGKGTKKADDEVVMPCKACSLM